MHFQRNISSLNSYAPTLTIIHFHTFHFSSVTLVKPRKSIHRSRTSIHPHPQPHTIHTPALYLVTSKNFPPRPLDPPTLATNTHIHSHPPHPRTFCQNLRTAKFSLAHSCTLPAALPAKIAGIIRTPKPRLKRLLQNTTLSLQKSAREHPPVIIKLSRAHGLLPPAQQHFNKIHIYIHATRSVVKRIRAAV